MVIGCFGLQKEFSMRLYSAVLIEFWRTEWHPVIFLPCHSALLIGHIPGWISPQSRSIIFKWMSRTIKKHFLFSHNLLYTQKHSLKSVNKRFFNFNFISYYILLLFYTWLDNWQEDSTTVIGRKWTGLLNNPAICYRSMNNIVFMTTVLLIGNELQN